MIDIDKSGVSIIICCYNSSNRIIPTLEHISKQKTDASCSIELLLINNASKDDTIQKALKFWKGLQNCSIPLKIYNENIPGLSNARNKGILESRYEYILFCDDDNWLNEKYVWNCFEFLSKNPAFGIVGGHGVPVFEVNPPNWFENFSSIYALGCRNDGEVTNVYGAGMFLRKSVLKGFVSKLSDRTGKSLISGGDSEICFHFLNNGYKIRQLCDNKFSHFIPKERFDINYLYRMASGRGKSFAQLRVERNNGKRFKGVKYRFKIDFFNLFNMIKKRDRIQLMYFTKDRIAYWKYILFNV